MSRRDERDPVYIAVTPDRTTMTGFTIGLLMRRFPGTFILVSVILDFLVPLWWGVDFGIWYLFISFIFITLPATIRWLMNIAGGRYRR